MTEYEILNILKESEIDALIAQKIVGLPIFDLETAKCPYCQDEMRFCGSRSWCSTCSEWRYQPYKQYSDEIEAAWEVMEWLHRNAVEVSVGIVNDDNIWDCNIWFFKGKNNSSAIRGYGESAPLAICRAALLAIN